MKFSTIAILLLSLFGQASTPAPVPNTEYAKSTLVVYNKTSPESRKLAAFYAQQRGIPIDNLAGIDCPMTETISREVYDEKIVKPLKAFFQREPTLDAARHQPGQDGDLE